MEDPRGGRVRTAGRPTRGSRRPVGAFAALQSDGHGVVMVAAVLIAACVGKSVGGAGAARLAGAPARQALTLGVLLNARRLTELIILGVGLDLRLIDTQMFTAMVLMALVTTLITGPLLDRLHPARLPRTAPVASRSGTTTAEGAETETATSSSGVGTSTPRE
ncbi:cation:proton antiporter [Streptomyces sp. NPDC051172]|uniref:cation:proton antiporter domain-containing protein n=1 Tax=Streptomyces sp. NPDC051172 TaxID=3155796 RepID=UPI00342F6042